MVKKKNVVLPPELPPDVPDEEVVFSDEDVQFVAENIDYAGLLSNLDTKSITKHVNRVADVKEDALESLYERRHKRKSVEIEKNVIEVDPVDALPVKTLDGELYYKTIPKLPPKVLEGESGKDNEDDWTEKSVVKLTKAEKRAKNKKERKEAKKQGKEGAEIEQNQLASQADVLDEVKKDLTAEETKEQKMYRLAELGTALLAEPETNIKSLREMLDISKDENPEVVTLALKSLLAVFRDIIPGYRIRLPTEKEMEMKVSRIVKKLRLFESTLLSSYKAYVQKLVALEEKPMYKRVAVRCLSTLLEAVPHFNFRQEVLAGVVRHLSSQDDILRKSCCAAVKYIFTNEGKHGGEATLEAVKLIANLVKSHDCQLHPDSIEVLMSLVFDEDLGKSKTADQDYKHKNKKFKKGKDGEEKTKLTNNERKKARQESVSKTREEVEADFRSASLGKDAAESRKIQSETLSAVFQIFFRVLRQTLHASSLQGASDCHPLLAPSLNGIGKFSHLIDLDFMADLMNYLRKLAGGAANSSGSEHNSKQLTVTERLQCCIVAFKVMKSNLDALNIDLQDFYVQLYNLILEYRPGRDQGEVLAEALKIMLCDGRQHDMQRAAAFIKRLATFSLCFGSAESMAALVTLKHLLQKNVKCRNLLENDIGGGSVSGGIAKYQPYASDPHISGALASVLWELNLLSKHYHPSVSTISSNISTMSAADNQVLYSTLSPQQAFAELSLEQELSKPTTDSSIGKKKKASKSGMPATFQVNTDMVGQIDENEVRKKLSEHFVVLRDISENEKLRAELELTSRSLQLYEQYKKQKRRKTKAR